MKTPSYKLILIILLNVFLLALAAENSEYSEKTDRVRQMIRLRSHLLVNPEKLDSGQLDSLLQKQIPLAFLTSGENWGKLKELIARIPKENQPVVLIGSENSPISDEKNSGIFFLTDKNLDKTGTSQNTDNTSPQLSCKEFLWVIADSDSLPSVGYLMKLWERTGKLPNFIEVRTKNISEVASIVAALNSQPKIFGVVRNGDQLLAEVSWKDYPNRTTNGYFSFPVSSFTSFPLSPYKAGYQFSPDIILPSPENLQNLKIFNAVPLDPDFGLTDHYTFSKKIRNLKRENEGEFILYRLGFVRDEERGNSAYFSGKAYMDAGLMSRSALKPNFSITAWIKPTELGRNNCILGKGKDFVLKIHNGLLTFTVQGIKDYYSKKTRIPLNQWTFIALVHNSFDNQISFYMNGQLTEKISLLSKYTESDYTMLIGNNLWEEFFVGSISEIKIWNRELNEEEIRGEFLSEKDSVPLVYVSWSLGIFLFFGTLGYWIRRRFFGKKSAGSPESKTNLTPVQKFTIRNELPENQEQIRCFGGLKVINSAGKDISLKFSPKQKQLFVLIFLHSVSGRKGIGSKELSDCLWPGMSPQNAKNIRGTNIQNLKALLASCTGIKLVFRDKLWMLEFDEGYFSDYAFVEASLNELEAKYDVAELVKELPELLSILKKGTLFPKMRESWVDPYIDRMSDRIIEFCLSLFRLLSEEKHDTLIFDVAGVISINDPLNEPALRKKISILTRQGKLSLAHLVFDNFTKLYFELYQEKYSGDFKSLVVNTNGMDEIQHSI